MIVMFMEKKKNNYCFPGYIFIFNIFFLFQDWGLIR